MEDPDNQMKNPCFNAIQASHCWNLVQKYEVKIALLQ